MFYVDIEDASGNKLGTGPITSATSWKATRRMDAAGAWSFAAPMADVRLAEAAARRFAHIYAYVAGAYQWVAGGPIDTIATTVAVDGTVMAVVSGSDMLRELAWRSVGSLALSNGAGGPVSHAAAVAAAMALAPAGWTGAADPAPGWNQLYGQFGGETVLAALASIAARSRSHYYLSGRRAVTFGSAFTDSGVRCVAASGQLGAGQAAITGLEVERSSYDLVSRVIPVGSGQSKVALTLRATNRAAPAGYTLAAAANYLRNDAAEAAYGRCERVVGFKDISPLSSTTADVISASNMLFDAALYWLAQHSAPVTAYRVTVAECPALVRPLQTVRVVWRDPAQQTSIDADLYVLSVEWTGDASGVRTAALTVADAPLLPDDDVAAVVANIAQGTIYQALPQLNANSYVIGYSKNVDDAATTAFRFRFDDDTVQLVRVVFDFQLLPLESTVKTVGLEQSTGGTISTSFSGPTSSQSTTSTTSQSTTNTGTQSTTNTTSQSTTSTTSQSATSTGTQSTTSTTSQSDSTSGGPSGGDTISAGRHQHIVRITLGATVTYPIGYSAAGTSGGLVSSAPGSSHNVPTNEWGNHSHGIGHTHDISHGHGISHTHDISHGHDISHSHGIGHTHDISHTHDIGHTHTFTPSVTTVYGIYRDAAANTFGLADLEYSVDGATWFGFAVGVNGYTSLGSGWHRVDLTALLQDATTLRPLNSNNALQIRRKATGAIKKATIDAQLGIRNIIQALALN